MENCVLIQELLAGKAQFFLWTIQRTSWNNGQQFSCNLLKKSNRKRKWPERGIESSIKSFLFYFLFHCIAVCLTYLDKKIVGSTRILKHFSCISNVQNSCVRWCLQKWNVNYDVFVFFNIIKCIILVYKHVVHIIKCYIQFCFSCFLKYILG